MRDRASTAGTILLVALAALLVGERAWQVAFGPAPLAVGTVAPAFRARSVDGTMLALGDYEGEVVLLDFWASWCPPCIEMLPTFDRVHREFESRGFTVLGVNREPGDESRVRAFVAERALSFPNAIDPDPIGVAYGVTALPTSFLIDRDGVIRARHRGAVAEAVLRWEIERLLHETSRGKASRDGAPVP